MNSLPGVRDLVRLPPGEGEHHLALTHWILSSKSFAVKTLQKEEVYRFLCKRFCRLCDVASVDDAMFASTPNCVT